MNDILNESLRLYCLKLISEELEKINHGDINIPYNIDYANGFSKCKEIIIKRLINK